MFLNLLTEIQNYRQLIHFRNIVIYKKLITIEDINSAFLVNQSGLRGTRDIYNVI